MKTLTLLRHAKSGWDDLVSRDFDRPLNPKGQRAAAMMGRHLRKLQLSFDHIVASPAQRVVETLDHVARGYGSMPPPAWDQRLYLASTASLLDVIHDLPADREQILLAGHNPGLEELILSLVPTGSALRDEVEIKFPTASLAQLQFAGDWQAIRPGDAELAFFVRPRDLDPSLGPDTP
ncbi:SixA phosphatase family protein [Sphingomonas sp. S2-65]|uniref:SixA phosphatase family protein n=1 Tax=Sphingomonas sp. S2-65 TaxID=2903960 RepID=UPI001F27FC7A|nr:histidine phosphatase family protein [Sphingomonas sp. S2-65]UYY57274.1 histidine phosphatase family protein [Sphingomonas sp. S2-65]